MRNFAKSDSFGLGVELDLCLGLSAVFSTLKYTLLSIPFKMKIRHKNAMHLIIHIKKKKAQEILTVDEQKKNGFFHRIISVGDKGFHRKA